MKDGVEKPQLVLDADIITRMPTSQKAPLNKGYYEVYEASHLHVQDTFLLACATSAKSKVKQIVNTKYFLNIEQLFLSEIYKKCSHSHIRDFYTNRRNWLSGTNKQILYFKALSKRAWVIFARSE